jgi:O-antigen/teichoic acid export membrane protein
LARAVTIVTSFITVPLTLNYLGVERYGLWMTISSFIAMMVFADFGIGNGLLNAVAEAYGRDDVVTLRKHVTNALVILSVIALAILAVFFASYPMINWGSFFNVHSTIALHEAGPALAVFVLCFAVGIPLGVVQRVQMGIQQGFTSSLWQAGGSVLGLISTLLVIKLKGGLPWLVAALAGAPVIILLFNWATFFLVQHRCLLPCFADTTASGMKRILKGGLLFFALQLGVAIAYSSDNMIIARFLGPEAVAHYAVAAKLFEGFLMVIGLALTPLWPAYGEAKARGDFLWIKMTLNRSMLSTLIAVSIIAVFLVAFNQAIFRLWLGESYQIPFSLVLSYALWMVLKGLGTTYSIFLNGMNVIRFQLIISSIFVTISIFIKIWFIKIYGVSGVPLALALSYVVFIGIPCLTNTRRFLHDTVDTVMSAHDVHDGSLERNKS